MKQKHKTVPKSTNGAGGRGAGGAGEHISCLLATFPYKYLIVCVGCMWNYYLNKGLIVCTFVNACICACVYVYTRMYGHNKRHVAFTLRLTLWQPYTQHCCVGKLWSWRCQQLPALMTKIYYTYKYKYTYTYTHCHISRYKKMDLQCCRGVFK